MDKTIDTQHFSDEIFNKLYPLLDREFEVLKNTTDWQEHCDLSNLVEEWQREFYSLSCSDLSVQNHAPFGLAHKRRYAKLVAQHPVLDE